VALGPLSASAVNKAVAEFDQLGRDRFLSKYGYGRASEYFLESNGQRYDSKAIAGVAYGYDHPDEGALASTTFSGGAETTRALRGAGFKVVQLGGDDSGAAQEALEEILRNYHASRQGPFGSEAPVWHDFETLRSALETAPPVTKRHTVKAGWSAGRGNWARVPWVAFLDSRETDTTRHGTYGVLLFREDMTGVYMTVAQGVTEPMSRGRAAGTAELRRVAEEVRASASALSEAGFALDSNIDLRTEASLGRNYELSTVAPQIREDGALAILGANSGTGRSRTRVPRRGERIRSRCPDWPRRSPGGSPSRLDH
jgi:5-methylcytosine-specific restriction enzyme B